MTARVVIGGDIGGTKTWLALYEAVDGKPGRVLAEERFVSADWPELAPMVGAFLSADRPRPEAACFAVAGPVHTTGNQQGAHLTNLPWHLESDRLATDLGISRVRLINDFHAVGYGIEALGASDLAALQENRADEFAPRVIIGAGTGLGVALAVPCQGDYEVFPTEGGHVEFAPVDEQQIALLRFLRQRYDRVSAERVISGTGLEMIYRFLLEYTASGDTDSLLDQPDPPAAISRAALEHDAPTAVQALDLFTRIYGQQAGSLALTCLATGGVYIAGGIAPKILQRLRKGGFMEGFNGKGRMEPLTRRMPVHVITNPKVGLMGAATAAARLRS